MRAFEEFLRLLKKFGLEQYGKHYSTYPGVVVDNSSDPEKRGRIKVKLPTILGNNAIHPVYVEPHFNNIAGPATGEFFPPYVNQIVDVFFECGDLNHPFYKGGFWHPGELPQDFAASYANVRGWVFKAGHKLLFDETNGQETIKIIHKSGSIMQWNADGSIQITDGAGTEFLNLQKNAATVNSGGTVTVNSKTDTVVNAQGNIQATTQKNLTATVKGDATMDITGSATIKTGKDANVTAGGNAVVMGTEIQLNKSEGGEVVTTITSPFIDLITGAEQLGVPNVIAG